MSRDAEAPDYTLPGQSISSLLEKTSAQGVFSFWSYGFFPSPLGTTEKSSGLGARLVHSKTASSWIARPSSIVLALGFLKTVQLCVGLNRASGSSAFLI